MRQATVEQDMNLCLDFGTKSQALNLHSVYDTCVMKQCGSPNTSVPNLLDKGCSAGTAVVSAQPEGLFPKL